MASTCCKKIVFLRDSSFYLQTAQNKADMTSWKWAIFASRRPCYPALKRGWSYLLLYIYYCSFSFLSLTFFFSLFKIKSPNSVWKAETRLVFHNYNKHFLIKEAFWWNLSPNLVKLTKCSVVIMTGIRFLSLWTRRLQIWTVCNQNCRPSTWTTLLPHRSFHTCKLVWNLCKSAVSVIGRDVMFGRDLSMTKKNNH